MAREADLDLVEVAPTAVPPVCRMLDYGKFKYEQAKKERESRKLQHASVLREIRMRPKIDTHDLQMKARNAEKFLKSGDKVKVTVMFRGREMVHPEIGRAILDRVAEQLKDVSVIEKASWRRATPKARSRKKRRTCSPRNKGRRMPKLKTHKGAKRRFHITGTGKIMHRKGRISHLRERKAKRSRRQIDKHVMAAGPMQKRVHRLLPYGLP
jgi:translation initiation factor IF-3